MVKLGWVSVGLHLRMNPASGGLLVTSPVRSFVIIEDEALSRKLEAVYEAWKKEEPFSLDKFDEATQRFITTAFPAEYQDRVREFVDQFCSEGKGIMLGILDRARKAGKLDQALQVLMQDFKDHWAWRPPSIRGSFVTEIDAWYVEEAFRKLGLPSPRQS